MSGGRVSSMNRVTLKQAMIFVAAFVLATSGCTKYVEVPQDQFETASMQPSGAYRIRMKANALYVAEKYSLTDSTVVISRLSSADAQYRVARVPITVRLDDVESIARVESSYVVPIIIIGTTFVLLAIAVSTFPY